MEAPRPLEPEAHDRLDNRAQSPAAITLPVDGIEPTGGLIRQGRTRQSYDGKYFRVVALAKPACEIPHSSTAKPCRGDNAIERQRDGIINRKQLQRAGDGTHAPDPYVSGNGRQNFAKEPRVRRVVLDMKKNGIGNDMQHETVDPSGTRDSS